MNDRKKVLFIGNCQSDAMCHMIQFDQKSYEVNKISIHADRKPKVVEDALINNSNIIITQRVRENYGHLSTRSILSNKQNETKVIIYPSCYMKLYYFDTKYLIHKQKVIDRPISYHYNSIINGYLSNQSPEYILKYYIENINFVSASKLKDILEEDIYNLQTRLDDTLSYATNYNNTKVISIIDIIKKYYNKKLLFYSFNHPTDFLLKYLINNILNFLNINPLVTYNDVLSSNRCILYSCLSKIMNFDIYKFPTMFNNIIILNKIDIINKYYQEYNKIKLS